MKLLVYAIVDGPSALPHSAAATRLRRLIVGRIAAVVESRRRAPAPTSRNVRQYHRTVAAIADGVSAILPARFGTLVDEEELSFILRTRAVPLRAALKRLRGRVQMTMRIVNRGHQRQAPIRATRAAGSKAALTNGKQEGSDGPGAKYLRSRVSPADEETRRLLAPMRRSVHRWVEEEEVSLRAGVISVYHLVPRRSAVPYVRALQAAAREAALDIVVSGPFPPYAFAATM